MIKDDANDWFMSQGQEIQGFEVPPSPEAAEPQFEEAEMIDEDRPYGDQPTITREDVSNVQNARILAQPMAQVIVGVMDVLVPVLVAFLIKGSNRETMQLNDEERQTLETAWNTYLGDKQVQVSPGGALVMAMLTIYGAKVVEAISQKKQIEALAKAEAENLDLQRRLAEAEQQLEVERKKG